MSSIEMRLKIIKDVDAEIFAELEKIPSRYRAERARRLILLGLMSGENRFILREKVDKNKNNGEGNENKLRKDEERRRKLKSSIMMDD